jgi:hypothetical protein
VGSNPTYGMDVIFCVCVVLYLCKGLATGRSLVQGVLPIVYISKEEKKTSTPSYYGISGIRKKNTIKIK